jgi:hypothetical protein
MVGQINTDVFLLEMTNENGRTIVSNPINISNNEGYDNQPSYYNDDTILFSSTRNGQTDIAQYQISSGEISWLTNTTVGSEYSPTRIPDSNDFSAIRLDTTGLQRLYQYDMASGKSVLIRKDAKIGYHAWFSPAILINTVLVENRMDLVLSNLKGHTNTIIQKNVRRSLHKIPNTKLISYIVKDEDTWRIKSLDPMNGSTKLIGTLPKSTEDICWMADGTFLVSSGNLLYKVKPESKEDPEIINLSRYKEIGAISRMAVSPDGKYLAIVAEEPPSRIVQKQVASYNAADLNAFVNCYSKDVVVRNFPADTLYVGRSKMRENYGDLSPDKKVHHIEVVNRITMGNKVIDQEKVTGNGKQYMQVVLYEVNNGSIESMTFIFDEGAALDPEIIVQKQLDAYNGRDIDAFMDTYTEDVQLFNFPMERRSQGQTEMRTGYAGYFETTPDLHCEIKNRIVIGNKVIDEEFITANGNNFSAVAIYEVENGKIAKVTFLR